MVRTKANCGATRATAEKATRKNLGGTSSRVDLGSPSSKKDKLVGGNAVYPRPTPTWQKPINSFFAAPKAEENHEGNKENTGSPLKSNSSETPSASVFKSKQNGAVVTMEDGISELE